MIIRTEKYGNVSCRYTCKKCKESDCDIVPSTITMHYLVHCKTCDWKEKWEHMKYIKISKNLEQSIHESIYGKEGE